MSTAHSQEATLTGDTIVDRTGRPTPIKLATAAQAFNSDKTSTGTDVPRAASDSAQKAISSSPSAYEFSAQGQPAEQLGRGSLKETSLPVPVTIPPRDPSEPDYRTLVLCFDGTGDQFDADNSNIVQLVALLKKSDRSKQMVYYQVGCCFVLFGGETKLIDASCALVRRGLGRTLLRRLLRLLCRPFGR